MTGTASAGGRRPPCLPRRAPGARSPSTWISLRLRDYHRPIGEAMLHVANRGSGSANVVEIGLDLLHHGDRAGIVDLDESDPRTERRLREPPQIGPNHAGDAGIAAGRVGVAELDDGQA